MDNTTIKRVLLFTLLAYLLAFLVDFILFATKGYEHRLALNLWAFSRMWIVTIATIISLRVLGENAWSTLKSHLAIHKRSIILFLTAPLFVYVALGVYIGIAEPLGLFDFNSYVNKIREVLGSQLPQLTEGDLRDLAEKIAYSTVTVNAYIAAITINAFFALGEEIGWRGYLYQQLGYTPNLKNTIIIGTIWALWHAPAILLLGYNYPASRIFGLLFFIPLGIVLTYPLLLFTSHAKSVLPAASLHGAFNALWPLTLIASNLPAFQRETLLGLGLLGILSLIIADLFLYVVLHLKRLHLPHPGGLGFP